MALLILDVNVASWKEVLDAEAFSILLSSIVSLSRFIRSLSFASCVEILAAPNFITAPSEHVNIDALPSAVPSSWIRAEETFFSQVNDIVSQDAPALMATFSFLPAALARSLSCKFSILALFCRLE